MFSRGFMFISKVCKGLLLKIVSIYVFMAYWTIGFICFIFISCGVKVCTISVVSIVGVVKCGVV
jgi:hypothetical protein